MNQMTTAEEFVTNSLTSFVRDPADSDYQRGFLAAMIEVAEQMIIDDQAPMLADLKKQLRRETIYIIKGETTGSFYGEPIPDGTIEWQFSDGPAGGRGSSADYLDLFEGLVEHDGAIFNTDEADFTIEEKSIFDRFMEERA
jgi:hypothetical protein